MLIHLQKQATIEPLSVIGPRTMARSEGAGGDPGQRGACVSPGGAVRHNRVDPYKWKHRVSVHDRSHTPHRLQTTLTPPQEAAAFILRETLLVSIDDLLAVVREFLNPEVSRSGLDRCLRRHGVGNLRDLLAKDPRPKHKAFKAYEPGYPFPGK